MDLWSSWCTFIDGFWSLNIALMERTKNLFIMDATTITGCHIVKQYHCIFLLRVWGVPETLLGLLSLNKITIPPAVLTDRHSDDVIVLVLIIVFLSVISVGSPRANSSVTTQEPTWVIPHQTQGRLASPRHGAKHWLGKTEEGEERGRTLPSARI